MPLAPTNSVGLSPPVGYRGHLVRAPGRPWSRLPSLFPWMAVGCHGCFCFRISCFEATVIHRRDVAGLATSHCHGRAVVATMGLLAPSVGKCRLAGASVWLVTKLAPRYHRHGCFAVFWYPGLALTYGTGCYCHRYCMPSLSIAMGCRAPGVGTPTACWLPIPAAPSASVLPPFQKKREREKEATAPNR